MIADREQRLTNSLLYNFAMGTLYGIAYPREPKVSELPLTEQIYQAQKKAIEEAAKRGFLYLRGALRRLHSEKPARCSARIYLCRPGHQEEKGH